TLTMGSDGNARSAHPSIRELLSQVEPLLPGLPRIERQRSLTAAKDNKLPGRFVEMYTRRADVQSVSLDQVVPLGSVVTVELPAMHRQCFPALRRRQGAAVWSLTMVVQSEPQLGGALLPRWCHETQGAFIICHEYIARVWING